MVVLRFAVPTVAALTLGAVAAFNMPAHADPPVNGAPAVVYRTVVETRTVNRRLEHRGIWWWRDRAIANRKEANARGDRLDELRATLRARWTPTVSYAIGLASRVFGVSEAKMRAVAYCESTFNPFATNGRYKGIFQLGWAPFGLSPFDPVANALSAAQTVAHDGSWRQWSCG